MARFDPVDPRVRLAIAQWPPDAPQGAVSTFCLEHAISAEDLRDPATGARGGAGRGSGAAQPTAPVEPEPDHRGHQARDPGPRRIGAGLITGRSAPAPPFEGTGGCFGIRSRTW